VSVLAKVLQTCRATPHVDATVVCVANVDRLSLAPGGELGTLIRSSASGVGESVSAWLIGAAQMRLRNEIPGPLDTRAVDVTVEPA